MSKQELREIREILKPHAKLSRAAGGSFYTTDATIAKQTIRLTHIVEKMITSPQDLVRSWVQRAFGDEVLNDRVERSLRVIEEALEVAQALGTDRETAHRLVDYVFDRPIGNTAQEIGGAFVTLYAAAEAAGVDAETAFRDELARINRPDVIERIRQRQDQKREAEVAK